MSGYLGEEPYDLTKNKTYGSYSTTDWIQWFILQYGQFDGGHHKQWCLDQVLRISTGSPMIAKLAKWESGQTELRISVGEPTDEYKKLIEDYCEDGEYSYDEGCPP